MLVIRMEDHCDPQIDMRIDAFYELPREDTLLKLVILCTYMGEINYVVRNGYNFDCSPNLEDEDRFRPMPNGKRDDQQQLGGHYERLYGKQT